MNFSRILIYVVAVIALTSTNTHAQSTAPECERLGFLPNTITTEASRPLSVFAIDLDGDGDIDVLSTSLLDNKIAWYENIDGQGTFGPQHIITTRADDPHSVFAIDIDGDGDVDVLSAARDDKLIVWYENKDGLGTLWAQRIIATATNDIAYSVYASDLDNDGDVDVLSASIVEDNIAWYENTDGLGTFGPQQIITTNTNGATDVFAADFDGDEDIDVVSSSFYDDKIAWYENTDGLGTFGQQQIITTDAIGANFVHATDLDGDGDNDILSASHLDNKIAWYENTDGLGTFGPEQNIIDRPEGAWSVFAADMDGDGDKDVLAGSHFDGLITWYENLDGQGTFSYRHVIHTTFFNVILQRFARVVYAADIDNDGDNDVLATFQGENKILWFENESDCNGNGTNDGCDFADRTSRDCNHNQILDECEISYGISDDCDNNNVPDECDPDCNYNDQPDPCDLADGTSLDCNTNDIPDFCDIYYYGTSTDCNFNRIPDGCDIIDRTSLDCNGNIVPDECDITNNIRNGIDIDCNNNGSPDECDLADGSSADCNFNSIPDECEIDCNNNGVPDDCDLANGFSLDCNSNNLPDECDLRPSMSESIISSEMDDAIFAIVTDLDSDGDQDVLSSSRLDHQITWYENTDGTGAFGPKNSIIDITDLSVRDIHTADINGDGDIDILSTTGEVAWYRNDGFNNFGPMQVISDPTIFSNTFLAADIDGDNDFDIVASSGISGIDNHTVWYENIDGQGHFGPARIMTSGYGADILYAADMDNDGDVDILSSKISWATVWFENLDGNGNFDSSKIVAIRGARSLMAVDLNGDDRKDVLLRSATGLEWYINTDGLYITHFPLQQTISEYPGSDVFAADLDNDGDMDVLSACLSWYENTDGLGTFGPPSILSDNAICSNSIYAADIDNDGNIDVVTAKWSEGRIAWLRNNISNDCNTNDIPDDCEPDCNDNTIPDDCEECCVHSDCDDGDRCTSNTCDNGVCITINLCGACCERIGGFCQDGVFQEDCTGTHATWALGETCRTVICDPDTGACCNTRLGTCTNNLINIECQGQNLSWIKGEDCSAENCPDPFIPTVSQWGLVVMTLMLLIGAKIYFGFPVSRGARKSR